MTRTLPSFIRKKKHPNKPSILTDHAIVRFLERNEIVDIKAMKNILCTAGLRAACKESEENQSRIIYKENGLNFVILRGRVVTITTKDMKAF